LHTHVYSNAELAYQARNRLYGLVAKLKREVEANPNNPKLLPDHEKYLIIRKSASSPSGYTINIRYDVIEEQLQYTGWLVIVSNHVTDAIEAISIYRAKDVVEKGFLKLKNCLDLGRLRVHSDLRMQNKIFIGFVALIIMAHIHKVMAFNDMYEVYTISKMLKTLERLRVQYVNGDRIIFPLTAEQKYIFKAFGVAPPV
jgi:transposase